MAEKNRRTGGAELRLAQKLYAARNVDPKTEAAEGLPIISAALEAACRRLEWETSLSACDALLARLDAARAYVQALRKAIAGGARP